MTNRHLTISAAVLAAAFLAGCGNKQQPKSSAPAVTTGPVIATVNDDKLTTTELDSLSPEGFQITRDNLPKILDKWVSNTLIYQEAVRRGIDKEAAVQAHIARLQRDYLVNELLDRLTTGIKVGQDQEMQYFNQHKDEFTYEVKISRIVLSDSEGAVQTLADLKSGGDFTKLAKERSQDVALEAGQESRYFARSIGDPRMGGDPSVAEAIFALGPGQISGVVPSQEGYQIIKLTDKKKVKANVTFPEVKDQIDAILSYRRSQTVVDSILTSLRGKAKIELKPDSYFGPAGK
ncbi:MAG TPA: peptidyl-prolyl cis-trans isomerase [bacterium]|nr:peptidyl-prolyl cis-trans isomerase [bacterium]